MKVDIISGQDKIIMKWSELLDGKKVIEVMPQTLLYPYICFSPI